MSNGAVGDVDTGSAGSAGHELVEAPKIDQQWYQAFPNTPPAIGMDPKDQMPRPASISSMKDAEAPWPDLDTFICMGDLSKFVVRDDWDRVKLTFEPSEVTRMPNGRWVVPTKAAIEKVDPGAKERALIALQAQQAAVQQYAGRRQQVVGVGLEPEGATEPSDAMLFQQLMRDPGGGHPIGIDACMFRVSDEFVEVDPLRPQCRHYARHLKEFPEDPEHPEMIKLCTARRDSEGEFVSLNDNLMMSCDMREPRIGNGATRADKFEMEIVETGRLVKQRAANEFDVDKALDADAVESEQAGIFKA